MTTSQWHGDVSGSIQKLPNELLGYTFRHYVDLGDSPWRLTFICKRWQDVALTTPSLWTSISITVEQLWGHELWDYFGTPRYSDGPSSICRNIAEIEDASRRAGVLPLQVHINSRIFEDPQGPILALINELFKSPSVDRIEELYINVCKRVHFTNSQSPIFCPLSNLKVLQVISMPTPWALPLFQVIYTSSAGSLHSLGLDPSMNSVEENISVFTKLKQLQRCPWYWPHKHTPNITIPQLIELEISCQYRYLDRLQLPRLQTLEIRALSMDLSPSNDDENYRPNFPQLVELRAIAMHTKWLEYLVTPKLQVLSIVGVAYTCPTYPQIHLLPPNLFPTVKNFVFITSVDQPGDGDGDTRDSLLISALQSVPNAISVRISAGSSSKSDPKLRLQLLDRLGSTEAEEILCPKLQDLELISRTRRSGTLADYEIYLLQRIADTRSDLGRGLTRFVVQWKQNGDTITRRYA